MDLEPHHTVQLRHLLRGDGWKVVMHIYGERLVKYERQIRQLGLPQDMRLLLLERRNELLDQIGVFYAKAEEENPFEAAAGAIWATTMKLPPQAHAVALTGTAAEALQGVLHAPRTRGGSVV